MSAESLLLRTQAFLSRKAWKRQYASGLRDNDLRLGRTRYTAGETVLAQVDAEIGSLFASANGVLYQNRLDGTAVTNDAARALLMTPHRGQWHTADNSGSAPPLDGRTVVGDMLIVDTGSGDRYVKFKDADRFAGFGVLVEPRTLATISDPGVDSQPVILRGSGHTGLAAVDVDWVLRNVVNDYGDFRLRVTAVGAGPTTVDILELTVDGDVIFKGTSAGFLFNSSSDRVITVANFGGGHTRTVLVDPTLDRVDAALVLVSLDDASLANPSISSPRALTQAWTWTGAASVARRIYHRTVIIDPATGDDIWAWLVESSAAGDEPATRLAVLSNGRVGIGTETPDRMLELEEIEVLTASAGLGYAAALRLDPGYSASLSDPQSVTTHVYIDVQNPSEAGGATVTEAALVRFDADSGTHKALAGATTKTTPSAVDRWIRIYIEGIGPGWVPVYLDRTT